MVRVTKCSDCGSVMELVAWHTDTDVGDKIGTGDFDCRNCDHVENNVGADEVMSFEGWKSELFENVPDDIGFNEFVEEYEHRKRSFDPETNDPK